MAVGAEMRLPSCLFLLRTLLRATVLTIGCVNLSFGVTDRPNVTKQANATSTQWMRLAQTLSSAESASPIGSFRLGIETRKSVQLPEALRRNDCATDDECEDYSGLPKSGQEKKTLKGLKKPFIGLSITAPLQ
jgi:hypothetical protein